MCLFFQKRGFFKMAKDKKMVTAEGDEVVKELQKFINRRLK